MIRNAYIRVPVAGGPGQRAARWLWGQSREEAPEARPDAPIVSPRLAAPGLAPSAPCPWPAPSHLDWYVCISCQIWNRLGIICCIIQLPYQSEAQAVIRGICLGGLTAERLFIVVIHGARLFPRFLMVFMVFHSFHRLFKVCICCSWLFMVFQHFLSL